MKVGFCNGCFDLFHDGHLFFLKEATKHCDYLVVAVNSERWIKRVKGNDRPRQPLEIRMKTVRLILISLDHPAAVIPFEGREDNLIMEIRPHVIIKGYDHQTGEKYCIRAPGWKHGAGWDIIDAVHIPELPGFSTTRQIQT